MPTDTQSGYVVGGKLITPGVGLPYPRGPRRKRQPVAGGGGVGGPGQQPDWVTTPPPRQEGYWKDPDWASLIAGDPTLIGNLGSIRGSLDAADRARRLAIRSAIVQGGLAPTGWTPENLGDIDETVLAQARENPMSAIRGLETQRTQSRAQLRAALASRGILSSGALTGGERQIQTGYERSANELALELTNALRGYESAYADVQREQADAERQAREAAAGRIMTNYPSEWVEPPETTVPPPSAYADTGALTAPWVTPGGEQAPPVITDPNDWLNKILRDPWSMSDDDLMKLLGTR